MSCPVQHTNASGEKIKSKIITPTDGKPAEGNYMKWWVPILQSPDVRHKVLISFAGTLRVWRSNSQMKRNISRPLRNSSIVFR